jgi:hypothetical protein
MAEAESVERPGSPCKLVCIAVCRLAGTLYTAAVHVLLLHTFH